MSKLHMAIPTALLSFVFAGSAAAASLQPVAGMGPVFDQAPVASSNANRAEVAAQAVAHAPAAGEASANAHLADRSSIHTRAEVRHATAQLGQQLGEFPAASGLQS